MINGIHGSMEGSTDGLHSLSFHCFNSSLILNSLCRVSLLLIDGQSQRFFFFPKHQFIHPAVGWLKSGDARTDPRLNSRRPVDPPFPRTPIGC